MEEENKLPLKRVELSLTKFNEVAIPHHLDLLRQHKLNILKYEERGEFARVRSEQTHARRVAAQLRALLGELDALRRRVCSGDLARFDALTQRARDLTLRAIVDYLETSPLSMQRARGVPAPAAGSAVSTDSVGVVAHALAGERGEGAGEPPAQLQLQLECEADEQEAALREREAVLRGWSELQGEVRALHDAWHVVHAAAQRQREPAEAAALSAQLAADNTRAARADLARAERLRASALSAGGAALGALVGGPVGLAVGAKAGAAALLVGSLLGWAGGRVLGRRRQAQLAAAADDEPRRKLD